MPVGIQINIKWENLDQLIRYFERLPKELQKEVKPKLHESVERVRDEAKRLCPVDTGSLEKSIRIQAYSKPAGVMAKIGVSAGGYIINPKTGKIVDYAGHVEYGTSKSPAQPFLRPAFKIEERNIRQEMMNAIRKAMESYFNA